MFEMSCFDCDESQDAKHTREFDVIRKGVSKGKQATVSADVHCIIYRCLSKAWREKTSFVLYNLTVNGVMQRYAQRQDHFTVTDHETELRKNSCLYACQIRLGYDNGSNKDPG